MFQSATKDAMRSFLIAAASCLLAACDHHGASERQIVEAALNDGNIWAGTCVASHLQPRDNLAQDRENCREAYWPAPIPKGFEQLDRPAAPEEKGLDIEGRLGRLAVSVDASRCLDATRPVVDRDRAVVSARYFGTRYNYWLERRQGAWKVRSATIDTCSL